ncbi:MAG: hypothetical protein ACSW8F_06190, partial [bacterium]
RDRSEAKSFFIVFSSVYWIAQGIADEIHAAFARTFAPQGRRKTAAIPGVKQGFETKLWREKTAKRRRGISSAFP